MTNKQGTVWESAIVTRAKISYSEDTDRYPKRGQKGEPDLYIQAGGLDWGSSLGSVPVVMWKRLVGKMKEGRRKPDGERAVVVMGYEDFMRFVVPYAPVRFEVQAKWTSTLNVTRTLADLRAWMKDHS